MEEFKFSSLSQDVIKYTRKEALGLGSKTITTPHFLLGILEQGNNNAIQILAELKCDFPKLLDAIESKFSGNANASIVENVPLSEEAEKALRIAALESKLYKSKQIEPEHILLSLLRDDEYLSAQLLGQFNIDYNSARDALDNILSNIAVNNKLKEGSKRPKPLFKVAADFNVSTHTIVDILNENGFEAANRPNFKISPQMYEVLENNYKELDEDSAKTDIDQEIEHLIGIPFSKGSGLSEKDYLGRENLVQSLASMIASSKQETPFTIGLLGDWGSGKSNVMYLLRKALLNREDSERFYFTDFNAWQYEHTDNMTAGLAQEVLNGLLDQKEWKEKTKIRVRFGFKENGWLVPVMIFGLFILLCISIFVAFYSGSQGWIALTVTTFLLLGTLIKKITTIFGHPFTTKVNSYLKLPSYADHLGTIPMLKRHLRTLCDIVIPKVDDTDSPSRLVVFVDDLDRCEPETISRTLDAIRLVMDIDNVVVVIGIDHRIAFRAVEKQYQELADDERTSSDIARDYLGKIIQLPITLNQPSEKELNNFITSSLFKNVIETESDKSGIRLVKVKKEEQNELNEELDEIMPTKSTSMTLKQHGGNDDISTGTEVLLDKDMYETLDEREYFITMCQLFGINNPRQLIRLKNCYRLLKRISNGSEHWMEKMTMLFWLEFLYAQKREDRIEIEKCFANQNLNEVLRCSNEGHLNSQIVDELESVFSIYDDDFSMFNEIKSQVKRLVLPHSESYVKAKRDEENSSNNTESKS